jgi:hypothetical protein
MLLYGEERQICLQMDEQIVREVLLRTVVRGRRVLQPRPTFHPKRCYRIFLLLGYAFLTSFYGTDETKFPIKLLLI